MVSSTGWKHLQRRGPRRCYRFRGPGMIPISTSLPSTCLLKMDIFSTAGCVSSNVFLINILGSRVFCRKRKNKLLSCHHVKVFKTSLSVGFLGLFSFSNFQYSTLTLIYDQTWKVCPSSFRLAFCMVLFLPSVQNISTKIHFY